MTPDIDPFERADLPGGPVYYRDSDHSYWREIAKRSGEWCGKGRLTGVSTVVGPMDFRPDALLRWAAKSNGAGVAMLAAEGLSLEDADDMRAALRWLESPESIWQALVDNHATFEDIREEAASRGTNVHKDSLHAMALGRPVPDFSEMTDEEKGYSMGVVGFFHDHDPETIQAEQVVADLELGVAGRFDLFCTPRARCDDALCPCHYLLPGETARIDAKTSGYISAKAHVQLGGYEHCAQVSGLDGSDAQWILQLAEDGAYRVILSHGTADDFRAALDVYRRSGRVGREANQARKAREAVLA
jgi:hypothetical protein